MLLVCLSSLPLELHRGKSCDWRGWAALILVEFCGSLWLCATLLKIRWQLYIPECLHTGKELENHLLEALKICNNSSTWQYLLSLSLSGIFQVQVAITTCTNRAVCKSSDVTVPGKLLRDCRKTRSDSNEVWHERRGWSELLGLRLNLL